MKSGYYICFFYNQPKNRLIVMSQLKLECATFELIQHQRLNIANFALKQGEF